jgi:hypothetical protein
MGVERVLVVVLMLLLVLQPPLSMLTFSQASPVDSRGESEGPQNLTIEWNGEYAILSWSPPTYRTDDVVGYNVTWYRGSGSMFFREPYYFGRRGPENTVRVNDTEWLHTSVEFGIYYTYRVIALFPEGEGEVPSQTGTAPWLDLPSEPTNLTANRTTGQLLLDWEGPDDGGAPIIEYRVFRGRYPDQMKPLTVSKGKYGWDFGMGYSQPPTAIVDNGNLSSEMERRYVQDMLRWHLSDADKYEKVLSDNITFYYRVQAVTIKGEGPVSVILVVPPIGAPEAPANLGWSLAPKGIDLTWEAPPETNGTPVLKYNVFRRNQYENWTLVGSVPGEDLNFRDIYADPYYEYEYSVSAVNVMGQGPISEGVTLPGNLTLPSEEDGEEDPWPPALVVVSVVGLWITAGIAISVRLRRRKQGTR